MIEEQKHSSKEFKRNLLFSAISLCLPLAAQTADFPVSVSNDDGTGNTPGTLSHAIKETSITVGLEHNIILQTDVNVQGVMKRLIDSNITIQSDATRRSISGDGMYRPLFIKSGNVTIQGVDIINGYAKGGGTDSGGVGAGLGGALFIYDGNVSLNDVTIDNSSAIGGDDLSDFSSAGGGMLGDSGVYYGGGGLFASGSGNMGGDGVYDSYQSPAFDFGKGGDFTGYIPGENGGFGGGGGFPSGDGGFGGGGANITGNNQAGNGGFGASGPYAGSYGTYSGFPGYGATNNGAAGMGGAIFIRTGQLSITNSTLSNNEATGSNDAKGLGGAVFVVHSTENINNLTPASQQGMPQQLATVTGCGNTFSGNMASSDGGVNDNDDNVFDLGGVAEDLSQLCPMQQNLMVTVPVDNGIGDTANTLSWAIKESNAIPGDDTITLATNVTITGVMKRLIDSNVTIQSDDTRRSINGNVQFRPLFIKSGQVELQNFDVNNGFAQGGYGFTGGAGMGGSLFVYDGVVTIENMNFNNSTAVSGLMNFGTEGGGGMFGHGATGGGGGLFASAVGGTGGHSGFYGNFGRGGNESTNSKNGYFGGGGGKSSNLIFSGGDGGFGGGSGNGVIDGDGGFGGGSDNNPGFGASRQGAGMGGAVFIRSGTVVINNTEFNDNLTNAVSGASGLGGGIFIVHTTTNEDASQQGMPSTLANVSGCGNSFSNNSASHDAGTANNNDDLFDTGGRISGYPLDFPCSGSLHLKVTEAIDDGTGNIPNTLSWAIIASNSIPGNDTITFETDVVLTSQSSSLPNRGRTGTPTINSKVKILGNSHTLERDSNLACNIDGTVAASEFRLLLVGVNGDLDINNINLKNGCVDGNNLPSGGALLNAGIMTVNGVTFINNRANYGGAIINESTSNNNVILNSTFSGNLATNNNEALAYGSAISNEGALHSIVNNTFYQNTADNGGAIESYSTNINLIANNLFAGNSGNPADCVLTSGGTAQGANNISDQNSDGCAIIDDMSLTAGTVSPLAGNGCAEPNINGNCVLTHALTFSSEAIDEGDVNATAVDQRGLLADGPRDMGAFEFGATVSDLIFKDGFE